MCFALTYSQPAQSVESFRVSLAAWSSDDPILQESEAEGDAAAEDQVEAPQEEAAAVEREPGYVLVSSRRGAIRLRRSGKEGCWMSADWFRRCRNQVSTLTDVGSAGQTPKE